MPPPPVYLDYAATTPVRREVLEAMLPYLDGASFGNPSSAHRFGRTARAGLEQARREVAAALGAEPTQVIFTSGGTEADNLAVIGAALAARDRGKPMLVAVSAIEHKAVLAAAHEVTHLGGEEIVLPVGRGGRPPRAPPRAAPPPPPGVGWGVGGKKETGRPPADRGHRRPLRAGRRA